MSITAARDGLRAKAAAGFEWARRLTRCALVACLTTCKQVRGHSSIISSIDHLRRTRTHAKATRKNNNKS